MALTIPSVASAHNVKVFPRIGEFGDSFQRNDGDFEQTGRVFMNSRGRFRSRWTDEDGPVLHRP